MKTSAALLLALFFSPAFAADCPKNSDACSGGARSSSPFLAASLGAAVSEAKAAPVKTAPAAAKAAPAQAPAVQVSSVTAADTSAPAAGKVSSPAWLFLVAGGLAGLYFYLAGLPRKGKRK